MTRNYSARNGAAVLMTLVLVTLTTVRASEPRVEIIKEQVAAWDAAVQARVIEDMADGKPSDRLEPPRKTKHFQPRYPITARKADVQGVVTAHRRR